MIWGSGCINDYMPNKRAEEQTQIAFALKGDLLAQVDEARKLPERRQSRSEFVREALANELRRLGYEVPRGWVDTPDRTRIQRYPERGAAGAVLNEKASSVSPSAEEEGVRKAVAAAKHPGVIYPRKRKAASTSGKTSEQA